MSDIPSALRSAVVTRANNQCEYCHLTQERQEASFHIDHVMPRSAGGPTTLENLALACVSCSLRKSARRVATDPETQTDVPLFNPRTDQWSEHFALVSDELVGRTPTGRATSAALSMNRSLIRAIRREELARGWKP